MPLAGGQGGLRDLGVQLALFQPGRGQIMPTTLQLNKYETAPNFIQLSQNLTLDCLLI